MKPNTLLLLLGLMLEGYAFAQSPGYIVAGFYNTQTAMPFSKFTGLCSGSFHPYIDAGYGRNLSSKPKHDLFIEARAGYFFHRFVQHAIPLSMQAGYRYKMTARLSLQTSLGAGYLHSIAATEKLKADEKGDYKNDKGIGRMQASVSYDIAAGYIINPSAPNPLKISIVYQQRLQMPFVKSYVPLLPYSSFGIGFSQTLHNR